MSQHVAPVHTAAPVSVLQNSFPSVPSIVNDLANSEGERLDESTQVFFSGRLAHDFSGIPVRASAPVTATSITAPRNRLEDEADRIADSVMTHEPADSGHVDLRAVRIHTGARAAEAARAVNARAYTVGRDVVFGDGEYQPRSSAGRRLLAHELAHVLQSKGNGTQVQRAVFETNFPGGGRVDEERTGHHRVWNFDVGQDTLKPEHIKALKDLAKKIRESLNPNDPEEQVDVEGQASSTGTAQSNEALAARRAEAVKKVLTDECVPATKIRITIVGEAKSEVGTTQENFARSRAVRVLLVPRTKLAPPATPPTQTGCQPGLDGRDLMLDIVGDKVGLALETTPTGGQFIVLRAGTTTTPGITITASAAMTPRNCGELSFIQNVMTFRQIIYKDGSRNNFESPGFVLDGGDPYDCKLGPGFFVANDGPGFGVNPRQQPRISTIEVREEFRMFLMFQPDGEARRTHQVAEWRWVGQARNDDPEQDQGKLVLDTNVSRITPQFGKGFLTSTAPVLGTNIASVPFVTDTSANPSPDSDAAKLVGGLNAARPRVRNGSPCPRPRRRTPQQQQQPAPPPATREKVKP